MADRSNMALGWAIPAVVLAAITAHSTHAQQSPFSLDEAYSPLPTEDRARDFLSTLQTVVRRYDFDAQETGPNALPPHFYRYIAPGTGFPPFGEMRLASDMGYRPDDVIGGPAGALVFDLAGGSMSARIGTSIIPILPNADYIVACRVRTDDLVHARARLVAWLCDKSGRPIPESRSASHPANTAGSWQTLSLEVHGTFAGAADLVFELQLVQPDIAAGAGTRDHPLFQDIRGQARFDDVTISHLPRVTLAMTRPGSVVQLGEPVRLHVHVSQLTTNRLSARLRIADIDGRTVRDDAIPGQLSDEPTVVTATDLRCGWYRAILEVAGRDGLVRLRWLDFVILPADRPQDDRQNPFGMTVDALPPPAAMPDVLALMQPLHPGVAIVPAWEPDLRMANRQQRFNDRRDVIERLSWHAGALAFRMDRVPAELAAQMPAGTHTVLQAIVAEPPLWQPYLDDVFVHFGLTTNCWLIGQPEDTTLMGSATALREAEAAHRALAEFVPDPQLFVAWPMQGPSPDVAGGQSLAVRIPASVPPHAISDCIAPWVADGQTSMIVEIERGAVPQHSPRQVLADAVQRGLFAWRTGASPLVVSAPWHEDPQNGASLRPAPDYAAWRALGAHLRGRRFASELDLGQDVHAWIIQGDLPDDAALIAWIDRDSHISTSKSIELQLNDHAVTAVDVFGNTSTVVPHHGLHHLDLSDLPIFVEGISQELVMFHGGVSLEPGFVPASCKAHDRELVLRNPWDTQIFGRVRLTSDPELELHPNVLEFSVPAHGEARLPLQIIPQRGILAGRKAIAAEITVTADRPHAMHASLELEVGLREFEMSAAWSAVWDGSGAGADVLITASVTSRASHALNLNIDLLAGSVPQLRRTIAGLMPGQTETRTFRIRNGLPVLRGQVVRLSAAELDGATRLNQLVQIGHGVAEHVDAASSDGP